ncbi:MAG: hypothetical protein U1E60_04445 [Reyranellaceae bacterium]
MKVFLSVFSSLALFLSATAVSAVEPIPLPKPVYFATGSSSGTEGGHVLRGERKLYSVKIPPGGATLTVTLTAPDDNAVFQIYEPGTTIGRDNDGLLELQGKALHGAKEGEDATRWKGRLTRPGVYLIVIGSTRGNAKFSMDVKVE